jgi:hypothetical protein
MSATIKIRDQAWREIRKRLGRKGQSYVKAGVFGSAKVATIGAVHEYGNRDGSIPSRSYVRSTLSERRDEMVKMQAALTRRVIAGKLTLDQAMGLLGLWCANAIKGKIISSDIPPPLKPATVARKGSSKVLIDTGELLNHITWKVVA